MADAETTLQTKRVLDAADRIRVDAATAEVLRAFEAAGVASLLLKGPALSGWIYPADEPRSYLDCDLWIRPGDANLAERTLSGLGFKKLVDEKGLPDWWLEHGSDWGREADGVLIDLHRTIPGLGVDPESAWRTLSENTGTIIVAGQRAPILSAPAGAMHIALHAAHHGREWGKALIHLERVLATVDDSVWRAAAALAEELQATDAFATGLRLVPAGAVVAERLGLPATASARVALHASTPPPVALGIEQLASAGGLGRRAEIVARKVVPPPGFIRRWWPPAARSRRMLALGYLYRPLWLLRRAPAGLRAWRAARRHVRAGR